jgi:hypothetical protein
LTGARLSEFANGDCETEPRVWFALDLFNLWKSQMPRRALFDPFSLYAEVEKHPHAVDRVYGRCWAELPGLPEAIKIVHADSLTRRLPKYPTISFFNRRCF